LRNVSAVFSASAPVSVCLGANRSSCGAMAEKVAEKKPVNSTGAVENHSDLLEVRRRCQSLSAQPLTRRSCEMPQKSIMTTARAFAGGRRV